MGVLKKVIAPDEARKTAYAAASYEVGSWCSLNGVFSAADIVALGTANSNKPGYAYVGDPKLTQVTTGVMGRVYPIDKLIFIREDSDSSHDTVAAGEACNYYTAGRFETDQYTDVSGTGGAFGDYLKLGTGGKLVEEATATTETAQSVARVIKVNDEGPNVDKKTLVFEIIS